MKNEEKYPIILIINDGNRRWAKREGLTIKDGYAEMVKRICFVCDELKTKGFEKVYITLCSVSNLSRAQQEIDIAYEQYLLTPHFTKNKVKIELHGNLNLIPDHFKERYKTLVDETSRNSDFTLHYMVNWSVDDEVVRVYNRLHDKFPTINSEILNENLDIKDSIDLIIRTGNRKRLSSCVPLGSPFAEIYFLDILFPEINQSHINDALCFYNNQTRTYGK